MAGSDSTVEIKITASQDASVKASVAATKADIASLGTATQVSSAQIKAAMGGSVANGEALMAALKGATVAQATLGTTAVGAAAEVVPAVKAAEAATSGLHFATSGAIQEYVHLGHEVLTGSFSRVPGTLIVTAGRMGGLTATTLTAAGAMGALGAAVALPVAALGIMAYRQYEVQKQSEALAAGFQLSGRGALYTTAAIQAEMDRLTQMDGVTRKTAEELLQFDATHADLNGTLALAANELAPKYVTAFGEKAPQALNQLKGKLAEISTASIPDAIREFEALNRTTLNLPAKSVPAIEEMIRSGKGLGASLQIVADVALGAHVPITSLSDIIQTTAANLDKQKREQDLLTSAMARTGTDGAQVLYTKLFQVDTQVAKLTGDLQLLRGLQAAVTSTGTPEISNQDRYLAQLKAQASMAHESALQRHVDTELIAQATNKLRDQGLAEKEVVSSAAQARKILGDQADITARIAAQGYVEPKAPKGPNIGKQDQHIDDAQADAEREAGQKRIENAEATNSYLLQIGQRSVDAFVAQAMDLESKRYAIEMKGLSDKAKADAGDRVTLAKDKAQEQVVYEAHQGRINEIERTGYSTRMQMREEDFQAFVRDADGREVRYIRSVDAMYAAGRISADQRAELERQFTATIEAEILRRFDAEHANLVAGTKAYEDAMKQRVAIVQGFSGKFETIDDNLVKDQAEKWKTFAGDVRSSFNSALSQLVVHGGTFAQFMTSAVQGVADAFLSMGAKIAEDWIVNQIRMQLEDDISQQTFLAQQDAKAAAVLASQSTQVAGTIAGSTAKTAVEAAGDSKSILNSAYTAAAKAYTSVMQSVPPPFNLVAAPLVAAGVFASVAAFDVISAEGGLDRVLRDGQMVRAHVDEAVLPRRIARPLMAATESGAMDALPDAVRAMNAQVQPVAIPTAGQIEFKQVADAISRGGFSGGSASRDYDGGGDQIHIRPQFHISAVDGASIARMVGNPDFRREFTKMAKSAISQGHFRNVHRNAKRLFG